MSSRGILNVTESTFPPTGKNFVPPYEDPKLKLGGLLALNLHEFSSDVEEIADQVFQFRPVRETVLRVSLLRPY